MKTRPLKDRLLLSASRREQDLGGIVLPTVSTAARRAGDHANMSPSSPMPFGRIHMARPRKPGGGTRDRRCERTTAPNEPLFPVWTFGHAGRRCTSSASLYDGSACRREGRSTAGDQNPETGSRVDSNRWCPSTALLGSSRSGGHEVASQNATENGTKDIDVTHEELEQFASHLTRATERNAAGGHTTSDDSSAAWRSSPGVGASVSRDACR